MLAAYEKIGCDGLNIGKYELLAGLGYLKSMRKKYAGIDFISANLRDKETNEHIFSPYKIIKKDNLNIGVIGLTNMVPDSMKSIIVVDYVKAGNDYIKKIESKVDIIVMLINAERNMQASLVSNFKNADFIFTSGSTHKTNPSTPQSSEGPFLYANGKQGKYLTVIDLEMNDNTSSIIDVSSNEQKVRQVTNRIKRLQKKEPGKKLEEIYAGQQNILNMVKRYRQELEEAESILKSANNKMRYSSFALNKKVKDDPAILAMVDSAIETCSTLNQSLPKKPKKPNSSRRPKKKSKSLKLPKPPKVKTRP